MSTATVVVPTAREIERALRLLESQRKASRAYYLRHKEGIKAKSTTYWKDHKDLINERRRQRYAVSHPHPQPPAEDEQLQ